MDTSSFSRVIQLVECHHTFVPSYENFHQNNHFDLLGAMERAHLERGFSEIAQNLTTFPDGTVAVCRFAVPQNVVQAIQPVVPPAPVLVRGNAVG